MYRYRHCICSVVIPGEKKPTRHYINLALMPGRKPNAALPRKSVMWPLSCSISMPNAKLSQAISLLSMMPVIDNSAIILCLRPPTISKMPLMPCSAICKAKMPWIAWSVVMSVLVKPKWRCAQPILPLPILSKWRYWCPPHCWRSSTLRTSVTALPTSLWKSIFCHGSNPRKSKMPP